MGFFNIALLCFLACHSNGDERHCAKDEQCGADDPNRSNLYREDSSLAKVKAFPPDVEKTGKNDVNLGVVACGDRLAETLNMIKSVLLFGDTKINIHIFADDDLMPKFNDTLRSWKENLKNTFSFNLYPIQFPRSVDADEWKNLFKPCASQRLFIHDLLVNIESLVYVDTDVLFLGPIYGLWKHFDEFNETQIAGTTGEHEEPQAGWYNRFAQHPYVPPYGINSGVMLMNLSRIRNSNWLKHIIPYLLEYRYRMTWGDQDLLNIYFHHHPEKLYQFPCSWNYRPDHCMYMSTCKDAERHGVSILHGNRGSFHNDRMPIFKAVYDSFDEFALESNSTSALRSSIVERTRPHLSTQCGTVLDILTKVLFKYLD